MSESWDPVDFLVAIEKVDPLVDLEDASFVEHVCSKHGVNSLSKHGYTVLMYAAGHRCGFPVVQYLLAKYAKELDMEVTSPSMLYVFEWNEEYFFAGIVQFVKKTPLSAKDYFFQASNQSTKITILKNLILGLLLWVTSCCPVLVGG